jgi:hypothetical protein
MVGIRGWRRKGREWGDTHELGLPDLRFDLITDAVERERFEIPAGAMAYRCIGGWPVARAKYVQDAVTLREALGKDAPYQVILDTMGPMPVTIGIGYLTAEEMERKDNPKWWHKCKQAGGRGVPLLGFDPCPECGEKSFAQPPAFGHAQHAMKRAEAHWWKQAADLPFAITPSGDGAADLEDVPITIAGTWKDVTPDSMKSASPDQVEAHLEQVNQDEKHKAEQAAKTPEQRTADAKVGNDTLFGADKPSQVGTVADPKPRNWPGDVVEMAEKVWKAGMIMPPDTHVKHVVMLLNLSPFDPDFVTEDQLVKWGKFYRGHRDEGMSSKQAAIQAKEDYLKAAAPAPF